MPPEFSNGNVRSQCPDCNAVTTFEHQSLGAAFGHITIDYPDPRTAAVAKQTIYKLLRCAGCSRAGVAKVNCKTGYGQGYGNGDLEWFWPRATVSDKLPTATPPGIVAEFDEAQVCMSAGAWRAGAALLRSTLEKTLIANGYVDGKLFQKIKAAADDGVITASRAERAQELIRTLGNDVLHDEWRKVEPSETELAHHYVGRVVEDFYDDRETVERLLISRKRLKGTTEQQ